jgi:tetratricopeptide (TPR) repeat protein
VCCVAEAIEMFNRAINVRVDNGAFPSAAKLCVEIAEIYLAEESFESSAEFFVKAADYYEASDRMEMSVLESQRRAADAFQQCGNWEKAIQLNESVCSAYSKKNSAANTLIVKELCFKNILLHLLDNQKSTKSFVR